MNLLYRGQLVLELNITNDSDREKKFHLFGSAISNMECMSKSSDDYAKVETPYSTNDYSFIQKDLLKNEYSIGSIYIWCNSKNAEKVLKKLVITVMTKLVNGCMTQMPIPVANGFQKGQIQKSVVCMEQLLTLKGNMSLTGKIPAHTTFGICFYPDTLSEIRKVKHPFSRVLIEKIEKTFDTHFSDLHDSFIKLSGSEINPMYQYMDSIMNSMKLIDHNSHDIHRSLNSLYCMCCDLDNPSFRLSLEYPSKKQGLLKIRPVLRKKMIKGQNPNKKVKNKILKKLTKNHSKKK